MKVLQKFIIQNAKFSKCLLTKYGINLLLWMHQPKGVSYFSFHFLLNFKSTMPIWSLRNEVSLHEVNLHHPYDSTTSFPSFFGRVEARQGKKWFWTCCHCSFSLLKTSWNTLQNVASHDSILVYWKSKTLKVVLST